MSDLVRRYLEQQRALGGGFVVVAPRTEAAHAAPRTAPLETADDSARTDGAPAVPPESTSVPRAAAPRMTDWRRGAPAIPGPGLTIDAPADLLGEAPAPWATLDGVARAVAECTRCYLCQGRSNPVPGEGHPRAQLMLVGEGPGQTEDETGRPFVGRAGELLTDILRALELSRDQVFICNVVKCRPPQNRKPLPDEMAACRPFLDAQIALVRPRVLVALGATAAEALLGVRRALADLRGKVHSFWGVPLVVTYHPAALLRNPNWKKPTWDDVRIARQLLDR